MAKQVIIDTPDLGHIQYTMIEKIEDIGEVPCHAPDEDLLQCWKEGKIIIVNNCGGYCFFEEDYHTIVREIA